MKLVIALFMVISVALCQKPTPCNTPQQWEARYKHIKPRKKSFN